MKSVVLLFEMRHHRTVVWGCSTLLLLLLMASTLTTGFAPSSISRSTTNVKTTINCGHVVARKNTLLQAASNSNAFPAAAAAKTTAMTFISVALQTAVLSVGGAGVALAVSGGGLDYAGLDISGQDFSKGNYKGKDFTQGNDSWGVGE
jgi:hypothetical protein